MSSTSIRRRHGDSCSLRQTVMYTVSSPAPPPYDANPSRHTASSSANAGANARRQAANPASERTPLLPQHGSADPPKQPKAEPGILYLAMFFLVILALLWMSRPVETALDPAARDRVRHEWDREIRGHEQIRHAWNQEVAAHETIRVGWDNERQELIAMSEQLVRDREQWMRDRDEAKREEEKREERRRTEEKKREEQRREEEEKREEQRRTDENRREEQRREEEKKREEQRRKEEEKREERRRREEEDARVRAGFYWTDLRPEQRCLRHGKREYTARLSNDPVQACRGTAIEIHDVKIASPDRCEDRGSGGVFGHWNVNLESSCMTYFGDFADKGCTSEGSRRRRFESRLWNLQSGDDWREMCTTTPADFRQMHFEGPDMCEYHGLFGVWGMWELEDSGC